VTAIWIPASRVARVRCAATPTNTNNARRGQYAGPKPAHRFKGHQHGCQGDYANNKNYYSFEDLDLGLDLAGFQIVFNVNPVLGENEIIQDGRHVNG
jgi:hypothetical protein